MVFYIPLRNPKNTGWQVRYVCGETHLSCGGQVIKSETLVPVFRTGSLTRMRCLMPRCKVTNVPGSPWQKDRNEIRRMGVETFKWSRICRSIRSCIYDSIGGILGTTFPVPNYIFGVFLEVTVCAKKPCSKLVQDV
ncbi:hypothetical protein BGX38DRAFT_1209180 [Terfezia claveryi]|nr:hypothetical protein BGX38DRAFT_1209180 [Terfezia claveryi]